MSAGGYLDACGFNPTSGGTGNFVVSAAITGYQTPAQAGAVNATVYSYRAESNDKSQWEEGFGAYTVSTTTQARSTITANSSGGSTAINFSSAPNVFITAASADLQNASLLTSGTLPDARLSNTITAGGPIGSATSVPVITYDVHGRLITVTTAGITTSKQADQQVFTGSGTWTKPAGFGAKAYALIQCWGGGAGGNKNNISGIGAGGGAYKERWVLLSSLGATETVTIGAGGALSSTSTSNVGGNTTMGSWVTAYGGGTAGTAGGMYAQGGYKGYTDATAVVRNDAILWEGGCGANIGGNAVAAGNAVWGGGGSGSGSSTTAGTSQFGGNAGAGSSSGTATAGTQPGGAGGSTSTGTAAAGAAGQCVVTVFDGA